jgi:hypothetical protein
MMTRELEVSILTAPLAAIDRRTLSQAWYSALHYARADAPPVRSRSFVLRSVVPGGSVAATRIERPADARFNVRRATGAAAKLPESRGGFGPAVQSSARERVHLAQRIERAFAGPNARPQRATFSLGRGNARVHVILQTNGEQAMLVALCSPELHAVVRAALTQARRALAARGFGLVACAVGGDACS